MKKYVFNNIDVPTFYKKMAIWSVVLLVILLIIILIVSITKKTPSAEEIAEKTAEHMEELWDFQLKN